MNNGVIKYIFTIRPHKNMAVGIPVSRPFMWFFAFGKRIEAGMTYDV